MVFKIKNFFFMDYLSKNFNNYFFLNYFFFKLFFFTKLVILKFFFKLIKITNYRGLSLKYYNLKSWSYLKNLRHPTKIKKIKSSATILIV